MNKLFLGISLLYFIWTVSGCFRCPKTRNAGFVPLECKTCNRSLENGECSEGFGTCTTKKHESCLIEKFYLNGTIQFARMRCKKHCKSMKIVRHGDTWIYECCWSENFCNKFWQP